jgi:hypothetical protein
MLVVALMMPDETAAGSRFEQGPASALEAPGMGRA